MYRIHYASRIVTDDRSLEEAHGIVRSARIDDSYARYDKLEDALRQAINDVFYGKIVLGIEDENKNNEVVIDAQYITAEVAKMNNELGPSWKRSEWKDYIHGLEL